MLRHAVDAVTQISLLLNEPDYSKLLEDMIMNTEYNMNVRKQIIISMTKLPFTNNPTTTGKIINYYLGLTRGNSLEPKSHIDFFVLYDLIQKKISLLPEIIPLLDELSNIKYDKPVIGHDQIYRFMILDYILKFFEEFPKDATKYFLSNDLVPVSIII